MTETVYNNHVISQVNCLKGATSAIEIALEFKFYSLLLPYYSSSYCTCIRLSKSGLKIP